MTVGRAFGGEFDGNVDAEAVVNSATIFFEYITTALALSRDRAFVQAIRTSARCSGERAALAFGRNGPFVHLLGDAVDRCTIEPPEFPKDVGVDVIDLSALFAGDRAARDALAAAHERTGVLPEVAGWLRSFASGGDGMTRETFRAIAEWQPLLAVEAFRQLTHASMALDSERRGLLTSAARDEASPQSLLAYWTLIHLIGNSALLATAGDEHRWLHDMVPNIPPGSWTPSFVLVRERCFRLGVRAGWSAAAFGEAAVARYLDVLAPKVAPLLAFDAVLGLTAIGVRHADLAASVQREMRAALASVEASAPAELRPFFEVMNRSAKLALTEPARARRMLEKRRAKRSGRSTAGNASPEAFDLDGLDGDEDCADIEDGLFPCIVALPAVVPAPAEALFRPAAELEEIERRIPVHDRARGVLLRTGIPSPNTHTGLNIQQRWLN